MNADRAWPGQVALLALLLLGGCARVPFTNAPLTIATAWPAAERARLGREFNTWLERRKTGESPVRIDWVVLEPGDDPVRLGLASRRPYAVRAQPLDLMLGGPVSVYAQLDREGRLIPMEQGDQPAWRVARRATIGWARKMEAEQASASADPLQSRTWDGEFALDDPRRDPLTLAWARGRLRAMGWAQGYAALVHAAGHATRIGRHPGAARAAVERGEAAFAPALPFTADAPPSYSVANGAAAKVAAPFPFATEDVTPPSPLAAGDPVSFVPGPETSAWVEGVAILQGGENPSLAERFLEFLTTTGNAERPRPDDAPSPEADALLADLLGATLVDAQDELVRAWWAWEGEDVSRPANSGQWLTEAPPWPPASVDNLFKTPGAGPLLDTLTAQITPDPELRAWLMRSWLVSEHRVDGTLLTELAGAVDGRLVREPRFRAWLRGEWTAWARQRYRRVERQLNSGRTPLAVRAR